MQATPAHQAPPAEEAPLIGKEDEDAFGADLIDMARRVSKMEMAAQMKAMREELAELKSQVGGVQQDTRSTKYERFLGHLADQVEDSTGRTFDAINTDPAFEQWIKASPSRLALFKSSISEMDTEGALTFFDIYAKQLPPVPQVAAPPAGTSIDPRLARQVAPGKSKSTPSPAAAQGGDKRMWTRSGIADFYTKMKSYPKANADALEREIALAQREGRVDYSK
jgi:hypothetical protein